jgi:hypothetical protein
MKRARETTKNCDPILSTGVDRSVSSRSVARFSVPIRSDGTITGIIGRASASELKLARFVWDPTSSAQSPQSAREGHFSGTTVVA